MGAHILFLLDRAGPEVSPLDETVTGEVKGSEARRLSLPQRDRDSALRRLVHPALGNGALICKTFKKQQESHVAISMEIFLSSEA